MMAVIFELMPHDGQRNAYMDVAAALRVQLESMDGFVSIERFESLSHPGKLLSLSFWRDEAAICRWRTFEAHRQAQATGRGQVFADYRLRVAEVVRDYGMHERAQAPGDSRRAHEAPPDPSPL